MHFWKQTLKRNTKKSSLATGTEWVLSPDWIKLKGQHQSGYKKCLGLGETPSKAKEAWIGIPFPLFLIYGTLKLNLSSVHLPQCNAGYLGRKVIFCIKHQVSFGQYPLIDDGHYL